MNLGVSRVVGSVTYQDSCVVPAQDTQLPQYFFYSVRVEPYWFPQFYRNQWQRFFRINDEETREKWTQKVFLQAKRLIRLAHIFCLCSTKWLGTVIHLEVGTRDLHSQKPVSPPDIKVSPIQHFTSFPVQNWWLHLWNACSFVTRQFPGK